MTRIKKFHLVFSGSGADFPCFLGAMKALSSYYPNLLQNLSSVSASSGGAIIALLLLLKFSVAVMEELCFTLEYQKHLRRIDLANLLSDYGLDDANNMIKVVKRVIRQKLGDSEATFTDLYRFHPCLFNVTGTNLSTMSLAVFNHIDTPDLPLWKAMRITTSVPLMFTSVRLGADLMCDGAVLSYYPLHLAPVPRHNERIIGLCIDKGDQRNQIDDLLSYIMALAKTLTREIHRISTPIRDESLNYDEIVLKTDNKEIYVMERDADQKRLLIEAGSSQCRAHFFRDDIVVKHMVRDIFERVLIVLDEAQ